MHAMELLSERSFPRHSHDQYGIGVVTSGAQRSWSAVGHVEASAGDLIMVNPGEVHDGMPVAGARAWFIVYLDAEVVGADLATEGGRGELVVPPVAKDPALARELRRWCERLRSGALDALAQEEGVCALLLHVERRHRLAGTRVRARPPAVERAVERLHAAPESAPSLAELAALCGVGRFQLLRGFKRHLGITPHAYLTQLRVCHARRQLAAGRTPAETAAALGFADQSHLTRAFVKYFGVAPGRYRAAVAGVTRDSIRHSRARSRSE